jgi:hypothetical protein
MTGNRPERTREPVDYRSDGSGPLVTAVVQSDGTYKAAFLEAGLYTVAFTCQAADDDPEEEDELVFEGAANVEVFAGSVTTHNFE